MNTDDKIIAEIEKYKQDRANRAIKFYLLMTLMLAIFAASY